MDKLIAVEYDEAKYIASETVEDDWRENIDKTGFVSLYLHPKENGMRKLIIGDALLYVPADAISVYSNSRRKNDNLSRLDFIDNTGSITNFLYSMYMDINMKAIIGRVKFINLMASYINQDWLSKLSVEERLENLIKYGAFVNITCKNKKITDYFVEYFVYGSPNNELAKVDLKECIKYGFDGSGC